MQYARSSQSLVFSGEAAGAYTYFRTKTDDAHTARLEARKPLEAERLNVYIKAADAVSTIVTAKDAKTIAQAERDFLKLYRGPLVLIGDKEVNDRSALLARCIEAKAACNPSMERLASDFNASCRLSIHEYWDAFLPKGEVTWVRIERLRN